MKKLSPLMEQYQRIKKNYSDKILFFRMGDFFEMFDRDAEIAAPILNIALTCRNKKAGIQTKMCGVPHHSISGPISKLLSEGLSVAICDQIEPAGNLGTIVKRAVTRVLSPGMVYDVESLDRLSANYMAAFDKKHISFLDLSTGQAFYYELACREDFFKLLEQFQPKEMVLSRRQKSACIQPPLSLLLGGVFLSAFEKGIEERQDSPTEPDELKKLDAIPESAQRLIRYVFWTQGPESLKILSAFRKQSLTREMYCSRGLYAHLEVFKNSEGGAKDTLFSVINRTKSPNGARLLKKHLQSPLIEKDKIEKRWDKIEGWIKNPKLMESIRKILSGMGDGERKLGKIVQPICNGADLLSLGHWLEIGMTLEDEIKDPGFSEKARATALKDKIKRAVSPSPPSSLKEGGLINKGVHPRLDEWTEQMKTAQNRLLQMEMRERKQLNIPSLKIRYNSVFGYYIEVRRMHSDKVPPSYMRKQTLVHAERYTTEELNGIEAKILTARSQRAEMEYKIFQDLRSEILKAFPFLTKLCRRWSEMDLYSSLAFLALENKYVRPRFEKRRFKIKAGRHPVLESKNRHDFVPNSMDLPSSQTLILTGPNMAGKSSLMRQMALIVLLAQCGFFVPADSAGIPVFHKMFTRIGAGDMLSKGLSTFMVEMKETAEILEKADEKSFIILDEIGRGTATFDGMSLAQAVLEFLTVEKKPLLLSATHYEELTDLARRYDSVQNGSMAIKEEESGMSFLYLLQKGRADKSYGIQTARLAGLPPSVLKRAGQLLLQYESAKKNSSEKSRDSVSPEEKSRDSGFSSDPPYTGPAPYGKAPSLKKSRNHGGADGSPYGKAPSQNKISFLQRSHKAIQKNSPSMNKPPHPFVSIKQEAFSPSKEEKIHSLLKDIAEHPLMSKTPLDAMNQIHIWQKKIRALNREYGEGKKAKVAIGPQNSPDKISSKSIPKKTGAASRQEVLPDILN